MGMRKKTSLIELSYPMGNFFRKENFHTLLSYPRTSQNIQETKLGILGDSSGGNLSWEMGQVIRSQQTEAQQRDEVTQINFYREQLPLDSQRRKALLVESRALPPDLTCELKTGTKVAGDYTPEAQRRQGMLISSLQLVPTPWPKGGRNQLVTV